MPKTRDMKVGSKAFVLRERPTFQIMDWFMLQMRRLGKLDSDSDQFHAEQMRVQKELTIKMVVSPTLDMTYFDTEDATDEDFDLGIILMAEINKASEGRLEEQGIELKKRS